MVQTNPFSDLPIVKSITRRERVLTNDELREVWQATGDAASPYGTIVRLLILTAQRRHEIAGMVWSEVSDDLRSWALPSARAKNGVANTIPMSDAARDLLRALLPNDGNEAARAMAERRAADALVLPGVRGGSLPLLRRQRSRSTGRLQKRAPGPRGQLARRPRRLGHGHCTICAELSPPACSDLACGLK
jgi:integrase